MSCRLRSLPSSIERRQRRVPAAPIERGTHMKALCWHGKGDMRYETVPDPKIQDPRDAIIKVTACAICGSDLHIYAGVIPQMEKGDVIGYETMGEVVEVGSANTKLKI